MLRSTLAALLTLTLSLTPLSAQTTPDCTSGRARGGWDLPTRDQGGRVRGILGDGTGRRMLLEARLTPVLLDNGMRGGRLDGVLTPILETGLAPKPIAEVHGRFSVLPDRTGQFDALMFPLQDGTTDLAEPIGKMAGLFADPMLGDENTVGRFLARWAMCR
jgi:hypothetical protein